MDTPILMYHALSNVKERNKYILEKRIFESHLEFLHINKYKCISADDYYKSLVNPFPEIPEKRSILTFDDGHESDHTSALPLLKRYNFKATFFITTDWIGKPGYMNSKQLRMLKEEGMSVQSQAKTHTFLDTLSINELNSELEQSQKSLEDILGERVSFLSFPGGRYNRRVINCAKETNYIALFSSQPFTLKQYGGVLFIGRYTMKQPLSEGEFEKMITMPTFGQIVIKASYQGKNLLKQVLGNTFYYHLWERVIK